MTRVMGIDLGIKKVAYSVWEDDTLECTEAFESHEVFRPLQLLECADHIYEAALHTYPDHVFIEETLIGNNRKYSIQLSQTMGAVLSHLGLLSVERTMGIYTVNVSTWKKAVLGSGNAGKEDVKNYINGIHSAYAGLCGADQDRYDAACIGYYGVLVSAQVDGLRLVPSLHG